MCGVWLRSFQACQHAHQLETGNTSDPTWSYRVVLQTVVWAMVSRQVTIVGSGMRRIDDRGRHVRRDVGRHSQLDDAQTFKATKKSSPSCLVGEDSVAMASGLGRCSPEWRRSAVALQGKITAMQTDRAVIDIDAADITPDVPASVIYAAHS